MLIILSPSKSVTVKKPPLKIASTDILFPEQAKELVTSLKKLPLHRLAETLQVSDALAKLNYNRYQQWTSTETTPALWLYSGDVYNGLDAFTMSKSDVTFAQKNLLIVSGLYGLVRPLDAIKPYRLEMKLTYAGKWGESLYGAWTDHIASYIENSGEQTILLCASKEYAKAVTNKLANTIRILTPRFMQETDNGLQEKGLFAKYARGALARFVIDNKLTSIHGLQKYSQDGFSYSSDLSTETELVYIIPKDFSLKGRFTQS